MTLFNFILFYKLRQNYNENNQIFHLQLKQKDFNINSKHVTQNFIFDIFNNIILSKVNTDRDKVSSNILTTEIGKNKLISRNYLQKLINEYFQETIFLSSANALSNKYVNKLRTSGLSIHKTNQHKSFIHKFSKSLLSGKINVTMNELNTSTYMQKNNVYIKYKWVKFLNFKTLFLLNSKNGIFNFFTKTTSQLINFSLPFFIVINNNKEIIISESTDQLSKNSFLYTLHSYLIGNDKSIKKTYTGLLFTNPQDALEYKEYIVTKYYNSTRSNTIEVVPANMILYYKLMFLRNNNIEFRLVPDLTEISNLIYKYKKYRNLSFCSSQNYSRYSFQGQPVYFIRPFYAKNKYSKQIEQLNYTYSLNSNESSVESQVVFLNYNTLVSAWKNFKKDNVNYDLPSVPEVSISNLETFFKEANYKKNYNTIIFLPSLQTYRFIKEHFNIKSQHAQGIQRWMIHKSLYLKTLCYRVFWSLTSRQPINW
uniref:Uncharacterized protein n=1 Tax=Dipterosiphonia australica TaxID=2007208 RepID=A0A1Z1ML70_9FLOR|nr:hypothetical protein [Dipterosiphonia australica]ARW66798.1 hypothetical protein [Dipterosiphonia australica]